MPFATEALVGRKKMENFSEDEIAQERKKK